MEEITQLNSLLEKVARYQPSYGGGLATHLPMVLIALNKLSAPNAKLVETFHNSIDNLELIGSLDKVDMVTNIESELGNSKSFKRYLRYFQHQLAQNTIKAVLEKSLPILISGIAASAFHGLIRLAYVLEANSRSEIAIALAYWSAEYQPFELLEETTSERLADILVRLAPLGEHYDFSPGIIVNRMNEIAELLKSHHSVIQPATIDLETLQQFALKSFYLSDDFTLLHTVTGCHAFSIILPFLKNEELALRQLWKAILVAYLSTGLGFKDEKLNIPACDVNFELLRSNALQSKDSHIIKLVYSCRAEYQKSNNLLYYLVAKRAVFAHLG